MRRTRRLLPLILASALAACSDGGRDEAAEEQSTATDMAAVGAGGNAAGFVPPPPPPPPPPPAPVVSRRSDGFAAPEFAPPPAELQDAPLPQLTSGGPADTTRAMIIRSGEAHIEVDSLEAAVARVERAARAMGGWIAHSSLQLGEGQWRSARLDVKIPAERWQDLVTGLEGIGDLRQLTTGTEDVGEQFVDVSAQLSNARRLEERYLQLLENRTGTLEDLLAVERELARVRERIERFEGRLRYLSERVAVSTIVVHLEEGSALLSTQPGDEPIRDALRGAWRNFLGFITGAIELLGVLVPAALLLWAFVWGWRQVRRRRLGA